MATEMSTCLDTQGRNPHSNSAPPHPTAWYERLPFHFLTPYNDNTQVNKNLN